MIIAVDEEGYIISIGNLNDSNAYSIKNIDDRCLDIKTNNYKYINGKVVDLGLKPELTMTPSEKIKIELEELDKTINRATEDLYFLTNTTPYAKVQETIDRKIELRKDLQNLIGGNANAENNVNE